MDIVVRFVGYSHIMDMIITRKMERIKIISIINR